MNPITSTTTRPNNCISQSKWIPRFQSTPSSLLQSTTDSSSSSSSAITETPNSSSSSELSTTTEDENNEDEEEYEYIEYDVLSESDFIGSEWLVGTNWNDKLDKIDETWCRLVYSGEDNVAVWGDGSEGKWAFDVASQFVSISKEQKFRGKQIWACVADDYYYLQGSVRGWTFISAASVLGQFQAKRLGLDEEDDPGTAPWFEIQEEEEEEEAKEVEEEEASAVNEEPEVVMETNEKAEEKEEETPVVDVSIPYDAAAKLAYEASDKSEEYADFKQKYEADAVAAVIAKQPKKE